MRRLAIRKDDDLAANLRAGMMTADNLVDRHVGLVNERTHTFHEIGALRTSDSRWAFRAEAES